MSDCTSYRPLIGSREGELAPAEAAALASHLAGCPGCRRWAAGLAATEGLVSGALLAAAARRDFGPFVDGVMARVEASRPVPLLQRLARAVRLHPRLAASALAAPLAAAAVVLWLQSSSHGDLADARSLEVTGEGAATTVIQSSDGPLILIDDDDDEPT